MDIISGGGKKPKPAPIGESGKELTYRNTALHRVVQKFIVQGGDIIFGNGSGGESIYNGKKFKDERAGLGLKHDRAGVLSMGNSGKNANTSQFFITLDNAPQCDGKHVVFGEVVSGMEVSFRVFIGMHFFGLIMLITLFLCVCFLQVVHAMETFGTSGGEPSVPIIITDCGVYTPLLTPGAGSWYDRPDSDSYTGITPEFMVRPRVGILTSTITVAEKFRSALGDHASTLLVAVDEVGEGNVVRTILDALETFALDVVVAAPACASLLSSMDVPSLWKDIAKMCPVKEEVFLVAKPVEVLPVIMNKSWLEKQPGWIMSGSFV